MQQIGNASFTVFQLRQLAGDIEAMQQRLEHGDKAVSKPQVLQIGQVFQPALPFPVVVNDSCNLSIVQMQ